MTEVAYYGTRQPITKELVYELLLNNPPQLIAVDIECVSLKQPELVGISIAVSPSDSFYFPIQPEPTPLLPAVISILTNPQITKIFHNSLFDLRVLSRYKINLTNITDTLVMAHLAGEQHADLETLANMSGIYYPNLPKIKRSIWELSLEQIATKCCIDTKACYTLYQKYKDKVDDNYLQTELKLIPILLAMSAKGIRIDQELRADIDRELAADIALYESLCEDLGFNPASPKQVGYMLAKDGVFLPMTRSRKSLSTDVNTLKKVIHPIAALTLAYREAKKLHSTYIEPIAYYERLHTLYHLDAVTGRISSGGSDQSNDQIVYRNMQNIPKGRVRNMFLPDNKFFTDIDFNQIELRVLAHLSNDSTMIGIFEADEDIHQATADLMGISRRTAKSVNFAFIYGATDETLMETAGITSRTAARELRTSWGIAYPTAMKWIEEQQQLAVKAGYITTLYGRKILLPSELVERTDAIKRKAINYPVQASAAEIVKRAMIRCAESGLLDAMRLQVHDELLLEGNVIKEIQQLDLENIAPFRTPYEIKLLERWE